MENPTVLVVDDDVAILTSFAHILEQQGYKVETAATGYEAIEKCKKGPYDLALLDIKLPDIDGTQLLKELHSVSDPMIIIMVTGYANLDNALKSLLLGADAYVTKPVDPDKLLKVIAEALGDRQIG